MMILILLLTFLTFWFSFITLESTISNCPRAYKSMNATLTLRSLQLPQPCRDLVWALRFLFPSWFSVIVHVMGEAARACE